MLNSKARLYVMRTFAILITILTGFTSCATQHPGVSAGSVNQPSSASPEGRRVTLRGTWHSAGKFGPYLDDGKKLVYVKPARQGGEFRDHNRLNGQRVEATGTLRFEYAPSVSTSSPYSASAADYFWLEAETAQIRALSH